MLSTQQPSTASSHRRGHAHKRSAAISGDFDVIGMDFFKAPPLPNQTITQSASLPKDSFMNKPHSPTINAPAFVITDANEADNRTPKSPPPSKNRGSNREPSTSTPSPQKKHTRLNSWAHSFIKPKKSETLQQPANQKEYNSSSSNEATPDKSLYTTTANTNITTGGNNKDNRNDNPYYIPEALIDLDRASGIFHDPGSNVPRKKMIHRRTESAPELEDFLKYKVFSYGQSGSTTSNNQKNPAIFEEEEEEDEIEEDAISSSSSTNNAPNSKNASTNSLNSYPSFKLQSPATVNNSILSTPSSIKTNATQQTQSQSQGGQQRRGGGATAARYQSYYNNSLLLSNALKSSESLSQITNTIQNKSSISSFKTNNILSSNSSTTSSMLNSPSRFKFESKIYDPPTQQQQSFGTIASSPSSSSSSLKQQPQSTIQVTSPAKSSTSYRNLYIHKKSNSLLSSINLKMRRNSTTSIPKESSPTTDSVSEDEIGDSTITPFNFGEPGPELDLTTMTPKYANNNDNNKNSQFFFNYTNDNDNDDPKLITRNDDENFNNATTNNSIRSPKKILNGGGHPHSNGHKKFFNWLKK